MAEYIKKSDIIHNPDILDYMKQNGTEAYISSQDLIKFINTVPGVSEKELKEEIVDEFINKLKAGYMYSMYHLDNYLDFECYINSIAAAMKEDWREK